MGLQDRFRLDELVKKGSKAIPRDTSGNLVVRKLEGKQIPPSIISKDAENYIKRKKEGRPIDPSLLKSKKIEKPYGTEPIKKKTISPRTKEDLTVQPYIPTDEELNGYPNQESFGGETSGRIEIPVYDEAELQKAKDLKVDELIKPRKKSSGEFVPKPVYTRLEGLYSDSQAQIVDLSQEVVEKNGRISSLEGNVLSLQGAIQSLNDEITQKDVELSELLQRYNQLLSDYQNSVLKGTKEGIERVSLTAQVKGLQAQKETLQAQLTAQQDIVKSLQQQAQIQTQVQEQQQQAAEERLEEAKKTNLLDIVGDRPQYEIKGTIAWAAASSNKNTKPDWPIYWDDRKKDPKGVLSGMKFDFFNIGEENVTLNVTEQVIKDRKWLTGVPSSITIPKSPDGGSTPGQKSLSFGRGSTGKGTFETVIKFKNPVTGEELKMKTHYWQARRRRKT